MVYVKFYAALLKSVLAQLYRVQESQLSFNERAYACFRFRKTAATASVATETRNLF